MIRTFDHGHYILVADSSIEIKNGTPYCFARDGDHYTICHLNGPEPSWLEANTEIERFGIIIIIRKRKKDYVHGR